ERVDTARPPRWAQRDDLVQYEGPGHAGEHLADVRQLPRPNGRRHSRITAESGRGRGPSGASGEKRLEAVQHGLGLLRPLGVALAKEVGRETKERGRRVQGEVAARWRRRASRVTVEQRAAQSLGPTSWEAARAG